MKSALVVGPSSMLGNRLRSLLTSLGWAVHTAGRTEECDIFLDLRDSALPTDLKDMDRPYVFHCAASFHDDSLEGSRKNELKNAVSGYLVAELCARLHSPQLVYAGSIFSDQCGGELTSYGASKRRGEEIIAWALRRCGIKFVSLRFSQLCDELGECCRHQPWFGRIVAYMSSGLTLRLPGGEAPRNFLYVEDAARMMVQAAEKGLEGIHPAINPFSISMLELARLARDIFATGACLAEAPDKAPFREIFIPDAGDTLALLGLPTPIQLDEVLQRIKTGNTADRFGPRDVA